MSSTLEIIAATLGSGVLTGVGAYIAVVWRLSSRVAVLEQEVKGIYNRLCKIDAVDKDLNMFSTRVVEKIEEVKHHVTEQVGDFRTTCAARSSSYMPREEFTAFAEKEDEKWQEFYRLMGQLEVRLADAFPSRHPQLMRVPPPTKE